MNTTNQKITLEFSNHTDDRIFLPPARFPAEVELPENRTPTPTELRDILKNSLFSITPVYTLRTSRLKGHKTFFGQETKIRICLEGSVHRAPHIIKIDPIEYPVNKAIIVAVQQNSIMVTDDQGRSICKAGDITRLSKELEY